MISRFESYDNHFELNVLSFVMPILKKRLGEEEIHQAHFRYIQTVV